MVIEKERVRRGAWEKLRKMVSEFNRGDIYI